MFYIIVFWQIFCLGKMLIGKHFLWKSQDYRCLSRRCCHMQTVKLGLKKEWLKCQRVCKPNLIVSPRVTLSFVKATKCFLKPKNMLLMTHKIWTNQLILLDFYSVLKPCEVIPDISSAAIWKEFTLVYKVIVQFCWCHYVLYFTLFDQPQMWIFKFENWAEIQDFRIPCPTQIR